MFTSMRSSLTLTKLVLAINLLDLFELIIHLADDVSQAVAAARFSEDEVLISIQPAAKQLEKPMHAGSGSRADGLHSQSSTKVGAECTTERCVVVEDDTVGAVVVAGKKLTNDLRQNFGGGPPFVKLRRIPVKDDVQNQSFPIWHPAADKVDKEAIGCGLRGIQILSGCLPCHGKTSSSRASHEPGQKNLFALFLEV